jgi:hypothetical protein
VKQERRKRAERSADAHDRFDLGGRRLVTRYEARRRGWRNGRLAHLFRQRPERAQPRRQRADHRFAERALVVGGEKAHQLEPLHRQARRVLEHARHALELAGVDLAAIAFFDHQADARACAERHYDAIARARRAVFGVRVVEQCRERHIERDAKYRHRPRRELIRCIANARLTLAAKRHFPRSPRVWITM